MTLKDVLTSDENRKKYPYFDSRGKITIGIGWNLTDNGLPDEVIDYLYELGVHRAKETLDSLLPSWKELDEVRQNVLINMAFNLGYAKLSTFKKMFGYLKEKNYNLASAEMVNSLWRSQVGHRADRLADEMRTGISHG